MAFLIKAAQILFLVCVFTGLKAQDFDKQHKAFDASYSFENKGDYTAAIRSLTDVYKNDSYEINLRLGWLYYLTGRFSESITYYQKSTDLMPLSIESRLGYVNPAAALGNWAQVEKQYVEILKIDPMHSTANFRMGLMSYNREDYQSALRYFNKILNLYPFDYDITIMTAWSQLRTGKLREARVMFQKALLIRPNDASALEGLSLIR